MTELALLKRLEKNLRLWFDGLDVDGYGSAITESALHSDLGKLAELRKKQAKLKKLKAKYDKAMIYLAKHGKKIHPTLIKIAHKRLVEVKRRLDAGLK